MPEMQATPSLRRSKLLATIEDLPRFPRRFGFRLFGYLLAFSLVTLVISEAIYYWRLTHYTADEQERRSNTLLTNLATQVEICTYAHQRSLCEGPMNRVVGEDDVVFVELYDRHGERFDPLVGPTAPPPLQDALNRALNHPKGHVKREMEGFDDLYAPILTTSRTAEEWLMNSDTSKPPDKVVGVVRMGLSKSHAKQEIQELFSWGIYLALGIFVIAPLVAAVIAGKVSRPVAALIRGADLIRAGRLDTRVDIQATDEIGQLGYAFNRMAERLAETMLALETLNRNLEAEVVRRTLTIQRAAAFTALLNAPVRQGSGMHHTSRHGDTGEWSTIVAARTQGVGRATGALAKLLDKALRALIDGTDARASAILLVAEDAVDFTLEISWCVGIGATEIGDLPTETQLARGAAWYDGRRLVVPLLLGDELAGCILLFSEHLPAADRVQFATHAASQLAIAVSNVLAFAAQIHLARELRERNQALAKQRDQLQEMNRLKSEFLANTSHELRTPLNAIMGYTELIAEGVYGPLTEEQKTALAGVEESTRNLLTLIGNILDLAKVESGKITVHHEVVDLVELVRSVLGEAAYLAKHRPYELEVYAPPRAPLRTDRAKVKQIITNLVSNAIKFTPEGCVDVSVALEPSGEAVIRVRDTGIGIRPEDQRVIFEEFRQVDGSYTREYGGTGLGLAIARRFTEIVGGRLSVESKVGVGSTFTLRLPKDPPPPPTTRETSITASRRAITPPPVPRDVREPTKV